MEVRPGVGVGVEGEDVARLLQQDPLHLTQHHLAHHQAQLTQLLCNQNQVFLKGQSHEI